MLTSGIFLLTLSLPLMLGASAPSAPSALLPGQCLTWGGNSTTTVFYGCCKQVTLETAPLAVTALCPKRVTEYDAAQFPGSLYTFSRLYLGGCLKVKEGTLVTPDDISPRDWNNTQVIPLLQGARTVRVSGPNNSRRENIDTACEPDGFTLTEDPPKLQGTCDDHPVTYPLDMSPTIKPNLTTHLPLQFPDSTTPPQPPKSP